MFVPNLNNYTIYTPASGPTEDHYLVLASHPEGFPSLLMKGSEVVTDPEDIYRIVQSAVVNGRLSKDDINYSFIRTSEPGKGKAWRLEPLE